MPLEKRFCVVCAWRKFCQKKFLVSSDTSFSCPDFTRDLNIKDEEDDIRQEETGE